MRSSNFNLVKVLVRTQHLSKKFQPFLSKEEVLQLKGDLLQIAKEEFKRGLLSYIKIVYRTDVSK